MTKHSSLIHSPIQGHPDGLQVWAIINTNCYTHGCSGFCVNMRFQLIWVNTRASDCWILCRRLCMTLQETAGLSPNLLYPSALSPVMNETSCCPTSSPAHAVFSLNFSHSKKYVTISSKYLLPSLLLLIMRLLCLDEIVQYVKLLFGTHQFSFNL